MPKLVANAPPRLPSSARCSGELRPSPAYPAQVHNRRTQRCPTAAPDGVTSRLTGHRSRPSWPAWLAAADLLACTAARRPSGAASASGAAARQFTACERLPQGRLQLGRRHGLDTPPTRSTSCSLTTTLIGPRYPVDPRVRHVPIRGACYESVVGDLLSRWAESIRAHAREVLRRARLDGIVPIQAGVAAGLAWFVAFNLLNPSDRSSRRSRQ